MELKAAVKASRGLTWTIWKAEGLNLGGWHNPTGIPQVGSVQTSNDGTKLTLPNVSLEMQARLQALLDTHDPQAPIPVDFPPDPPPVPRPPDPDIAAFRSGATDARVAILGRRAGLL